MANRISILLVDDDDNVRQSLEKALTIEDFRVVPAANRQEAIEGCRATRIDVVMLDLNLGTENGWDIFQQLRVLQPNLSFIIITAKSDAETLAAKWDVEAFMEKPFDVPLLVAKLNDLGGAPRSASTKARPLQNESLAA